MAQPRLPDRVAVLTLASRSLMLALAMVNTGVVAALASESTGAMLRFAIPTSCVSAFALYVDGHVILALADQSAKFPHPRTLFTACLDVLMGVTLAVLASKLNDENRQSRADKFSTLGEDIIPASVALTALHAAVRILCVGWICTAPYVTFHFHKRQPMVPAAKQPENYELNPDAQRPWPSELPSGQQRSELPCALPPTELEAGYGKSELPASLPAEELPTRRGH